MSTTPLTKEDVRIRVEAEGVKFIDLQFTDVVGVVKNVTIPVQKLAEALDNGIWFDGSSIEGFARVAESDMYLVPDPATYAILPWLPGNETTARLICNVFMPNGQPFAGDPRAVLQRIVDEAEKMGLLVNIGPELEFFLFRQSSDGSILPLRPHDQASYFDVPNDDVAHFWRQVVSTLSAFGITVEAMHHEVAVGQHEIDFRYSDAVRTADNAVTFRIAVKAVAQRSGYYASFMPKPIRAVSGSGMHVHQSLMYKATNTNAFADPGDSHGLSKTAKHFIAGQLAHAKGLCAIVAPLINSYKRLVPGYEAPVFISWGRINRSALIRVPRAHDPNETRIELRCPDPACNPYLAFAAMLAAGLDGIRRELPIPDATDENLYLRRAQDERRLEHLPTSLSEAVDEFEKDLVIREALGAHIAERFIHAKRLEWDDYRQEVTDWELKKYLSVH